ncbi:MAG: hypothetical protein IJU07_00605 [Synergistaceae bacterium]|nr:hypothetical protein [Synergistaceae bacterium]
MSLYESIIAGLTEAVEDARSEHKVLKRHTMEISDDVPYTAPQKFLNNIPVLAAE